MTDKDKALRLALEALENLGNHDHVCPQWPTYAEPENYPKCNCGYDQAITAIKAALEAKCEPVVWNEGVPAMLPKQKEGETFIVSYEPKLEAKDEPVAWQYRDANDDGTWSAWTGCDKRLTESDWRKVRPLYTTPPPVAEPHKRPSRSDITWVGLNETECGFLFKVGMTPFDYYQAIEAKLKEKNGYA